MAAHLAEPGTAPIDAALEEAERALGLTTPAVAGGGVG